MSTCTRVLWASALLCLGIASAVFADASVPSGWAEFSGKNGGTGSATYTPSTGTYTVKGSGYGIHYSVTYYDQYHALLQQTSGDCTIVARLTSLLGGGNIGVAMIKDPAITKSTLSAIVPRGAGTIECFYWPNDGTGGAPVTTVNSQWMWVKLVRSGNNCTASYSTNGSAWTAYTTTAVNLPASYYVGLVVDSRKPSGTGNESTGTFTNVAITPSIGTPTCTNVAATRAILGASISGGAGITETGVLVSETADPDLATEGVLKYTSAEVASYGAFTVDANNLTPGRQYHYRAYATAGTGPTGAGTMYTADGTFTTPFVFLDSPTSADVTATAATLGGTINIGDGIIESGVVLAAGADPELYPALTFTTDPTVTTGAFTVSASGLAPNTTYSYRAYARNADGTGFSIDDTFTTLTAPPILADPTATDILEGGANVGATVTSDGGDPLTESGVVLGLTTNPTVDSPLKFIGEVPADPESPFQLAVTGLAANTTYHYRAYAINSTGTSYTDDATFTTNAALPTIENPQLGDVAGTTAIVGAQVTWDGNDSITESGVVFSTAPDPTIESPYVFLTSSTVLADGFFIAQGTGLSPNTHYHYRAFATNSAGTSYTDDRTFTTWGITAKAVYVLNAQANWQQPATWEAGKTVRIRVIGAGFSGGGLASLTLVKAGRNPITFPATWNSAGCVTGSAVRLPSTLDDLGAWSVVVTRADGEYATLTDAFVITSPALTGVTLSANKVWPQPAGTSVLLTASPLPANAVGVEYEFVQKTYNTGTGSYTSTTVRASGAGNTYTWTPPTAQAYWMTVVARDTQSNEVTSDELYFRADDALITSANLQIINNGNGTYTLVASSTGGASNVQYRFVANIPVAGTSPVRYDAFVMQNYSTSNTMIWKPSAAALGKTLKLLVYARVVGSTANFQKVSPMRTLAL